MSPKAGSIESVPVLRHTHHPGLISDSIGTVCLFRIEKIAAAKTRSFQADVPIYRFYRLQSDQTPSSRFLFIRRSALRRARRFVSLGFSKNSRRRISFLMPLLSTSLRKRRTASCMLSRSRTVSLTMESFNYVRQINFKKEQNNLANTAWGSKRIWIKSYTLFYCGSSMPIRRNWGLFAFN